MSFMQEMADLIGLLFAVLFGLALREVGLIFMGPIGNKTQIKNTNTNINSNTNKNKYEIIKKTQHLT